MTDINRISLEGQTFDIKDETARSVTEAHVKDSVNSEQGTHGFRLTENGFEIYNKETGAWTIVAFTEIPAEVTGINVTPSDLPFWLNHGTTQQLGAVVHGIGLITQNVSWHVIGHASASIDAAGLLSVPLAVPPQTQLNVTVASVDNPTVSQTVQFLIGGVTSVNITPTETTMRPGTTRQFHADVNAVGGVDTEVTWSVTGHAEAGIDVNGLLTTAKTIPQQTVMTVRATSVFNPAVFSEMAVTIQGGIGVDFVEWVGNGDITHFRSKFALL